MKKILNLALSLLTVVGLTSCGNTSSSNNDNNSLAETKSSLQVQTISALSLVDEFSNISKLKRKNNNVSDDIKKEITDNLEKMELLIDKGNLNLETKVEIISLTHNDVIFDTKETIKLSEDTIYTLYYTSSDKFNKKIETNSWQDEVLFQDDDWYDDYESKTIEAIKGVALINEELDSNGNVDLSNSFPFESKVIEEIEKDEKETERKLKMYISNDKYVEIEEEVEIEDKETSYEMEYNVFDRTKPIPFYSFEIELDSEDKNKIEYRINDHEYEVTKFTKSGKQRFKVEFEDDETDKEATLLFEKQIIEDKVTYVEI